MHETTRKLITGVAALAAAGGVTAGIAGAAKDKNGRARQADPEAGFGYGHGGPREQQEALTGETKDKAEAAALAAVPGGKVERSEGGGPDGAAYHVHVTDAGGKPVMVLLDKDFKVLDKLTGPPRGGPGGGPGMPPAQEALTGDTKDKAEAAANAAVPGGKVVRSEKGGPDGAVYHVHMTDADGKDVVVLLDKDFKVLDKVTGGPGFGGHGFGGPGGPGMRPAQLTGDTADKAKAAALAAVTDGTVRASFAAPDGSGAKYVVLVERKSGRPVLVLLDADFKVVKKVTRPDFRGDHHRGGPGDPDSGTPPPAGAGYAPGSDTTTT